VSWRLRGGASWRLRKGQRWGLGAEVVGRPLTYCEFRQLKLVAGIVVGCSQEVRMRAEVLPNGKVGLT